MNKQNLTSTQFETLRTALHQAAADASAAMGKWLNRPSLLQLESIDQVSLSEATGLLGEDTVCCGSMQMPEEFPGQLLLVFDQASGLGLADMLLQQPLGSSSEWGEMEESAALESTNILCCAYLNSLVNQLVSDDHEIRELVPLPPEFRHDFAESILQFALMGQAMQGDEVLLVRTRFELEEAPLSWTLLWIPDSHAIHSLPQFVGSD